MREYYKKQHETAVFIISIVVAFLLHLIGFRLNNTELMKTSQFLVFAVAFRFFMNGIVDALVEISAKYTINQAYKEFKKDLKAHLEFENPEDEIDDEDIDMEKCEDCPAKDECTTYQNKINEQNEIEGQVSFDELENNSQK